jgi:hypothetical protein
VRACGGEEWRVGRKVGRGVVGGKREEGRGEEKVRRERGMRRDKGEEVREAKLVQ